MRWLILHFSEIINGEWPEKPGGYSETPKQACKEARKQGWEGLCVNCPFKPCLNPAERTPMKNRKEGQRNKILEIAAEVEARLEMVMPYISGWPRPDRVVYKDGSMKKRKRFEAKTGKLLTNHE